VTIRLSEFLTDGMPDYQVEFLSDMPICFIQKITATLNGSGYFTLRLSTRLISLRMVYIDGMTIRSIKIAADG
jgi:hypothetical protein